MFYRRRQEVAERSDLEARGASFWTDEFESPVRVKTVYAIRRAANGRIDDVMDTASLLLLQDEGLEIFDTMAGRSRSMEVLVKHGHTADYPSAVEAVIAAARLVNAHRGPVDVDDFIADMNRVFVDHRVSFEIVNDRMVPFESRELHEAVVQPALTLLGGDPRFVTVEAAYSEALEQLAQGNAPNAITDAGRALQECLVLLGAEGNALGPLIASARKKGVLGAHDTALTAGVAKLMEWVSADRSTMGDAHVATGATEADAWLAIHVVGALVLRLSRGPRGG